jgi:hypothetical protein
MADERAGSAMMRLYRWSIRKFPQIVDCQPISLQAVLSAAGFKPKANQLLSLWGLPVRLILAQK